MNVDDGEELIELEFVEIRKCAEIAPKEFDCFDG